ncbi:EAL domain-containing protein [Siminovitchia fortis]|uniref:EAL domain-containing protein n=1 Tax=Siminovitchia fortis TaxID=254758 RepID=UPI00119FA50B|nr:EAL domain-containing protein [Siminovitchia fortis]
MSFKRFIQTEQFYHFFQPIYDLENSRKVGYEALLRAKTYPNPELTFQMAKKENQLYELDSRSIQKAVFSFNEVRPSGEYECLFLNAFPSTILNPSFPAFLNRMMAGTNLKKQRIVLEISESEVIEDLLDFKQRISELRQDGFLIAIDDIGTGYSNVESIIELEPDYLKLDRYFAQDLHMSQGKQEFISVFKNYCEKTKSGLILEGVETEEELQAAKALGISIAQGYFLGKPALLCNSEFNSPILVDQRNNSNKE